MLLPQNSHDNALALILRYIRRLICKLLIILNLNWHWCYICLSFSNNHCRSYGVPRAFCQVWKEKQKLLGGWEFQIISSGLSF
jgi:hypothetical protein